MRLFASLPVLASTFRMRAALLIVGAAVVDTPAHAGVCQPPTVEKESPYRYAVTLADALSYAKSALDRTSPATLGSEPTNFAVLFAMKLAKADFECAQSQVEPFVPSSNEAIETSARGAGMAFKLLAAFVQKTIDDHKALLDSVAEGKPLKPGTALEREAELAASADDVWKNILIPSVIAGTYAVVEVDQTTGLMSRLALTRAERDQILQRLTSTFGDEVKAGLAVGQIPLMTAAAVLYKVVGDPKRKLRDPQ